MKKLFLAIIFSLVLTVNALALVSDISPKSALYQCDGATTGFSFVFTAQEQTDLDVFIVDSSNTPTELTLTTDYTVSLNADGTGSITTVQTYSSAYQLMIKRNTPETQTLDLQEGGFFSAEALEDALDRNVRLTQENTEKISRAALLPTTSQDSIAFPTPAANKSLCWDESASALTNCDTTTATSTVFDHIGNYDSLADAVSDIGSAVTTLVIDVETIIADGTSVTTPTTLSLMIINGGSIDGVSGGGTETLNINGPIIVGDYEVFGDNIDVSGLAYVTDRWFGAIGDFSGSGTDNLSAFDKMFSAVSSDGGTIHIKLNNDGNNDYYLSDSWNLASKSNIKLIIDKGVTIRTTAATTYGHTLSVVEGSTYGGTDNATIENIEISGGGTIRNSGSSGADNGIGLERVKNWRVIGMNLPAIDRKAITVQVNDITGNVLNFNGDGYVLDNTIGTTGHTAISIEGGNSGTTFIDKNTCLSAGENFISLIGSNSPAVDLQRVKIGENYCAAATEKGLFAFRVIDLELGKLHVATVGERGLDINTCGDVYVGPVKVLSTGSWGARIDSCTGALTIGDGATIKTNDGTFPDLYLNANTSNCLIGAAHIGDGTGAYPINSATKTAQLSGPQIITGATGLFLGLDPIGYAFVDGQRYDLPIPSATFTDGDTTPDVSGGKVFKTANTGATSITNFDGGRDGQTIIIVANDTNTTVVDGANIKLEGSVNWVPTAGNDAIILTRVFSTWIQAAPASDN